ncbi:hypothetical protein [Oceanispirochaeta sp.]|jgi:phosphatidate phosphatase PAH1|uniref:hypothetical protein n=1 Tax=Oceanispirochaeta sp. TaxID=2035350 RepID=UPI0026333A97|nr:hypothetical protein [Oceanispirochaeta sp.]MDA3958239.1 hypothetical protein [Oceanispirochaeta sp.]
MRLANIMASINKKLIITIAVSALVITFLIVASLIIIDYREDKSIKDAEQRKMAYDMSKLSQSTKSRNRCELIYPEIIEELDLTIDPYRDLNFKWTEDEISRLWLEPDAADIDYFTDANHKLIWDILKDAP